MWPAETSVVGVIITHLVNNSSCSSSPEWYEQLYRGLRMKATVVCLKCRGRVSKNVVGVSAEALKTVQCPKLDP